MTPTTPHAGDPIELQPGEALVRIADPATAFQRLQPHPWPVAPWLRET